MTLATRCPQCGTTFRVVSDQLKLRKGLVKCGKCLHVFNGIEFLHYFSEPNASEPNQNTADANAPLPQPVTAHLSAPTPEFLGVDDAPAAAPMPVQHPAVAAPAEVATTVETAPPDESAPVVEITAPGEPLQTPAMAEAQFTGFDQPPEPVPDDTAPASIDIEHSQPTAQEVPAQFAAAVPEISATEATEPVAMAHDGEPTHVEAAIDAHAEIDADGQAAPISADVPASEHTAPPTADARTEDASARLPWYARLDRQAAAPQAEPAQADEDIVAAPAPESTREAEIDAIAEMRERVARARQAAEADEDAAALSPLTLVDVARQSSEAVEDRFEELPAFLRERRRAPAWVRVLIVILAVLGFLALIGQATYVYRAEIAAEFPALRSSLTTACAALPDAMRCELGLPRHITPLRVVSADLQPVEGGNFNLVVAIHNDDALPMAYPALDIILTDAHTQVLIRRVVTADEYLGAHRDAADRRRVGLAGNAETNITVPMHIADEGVVGYTVSIFYP